MLPVAVARSSSDGVAIRYVLPFLRNDVIFSYRGASGPESSTTLCLEVRQVAVSVGRQTTIQCSVEYVRMRHRGRSLTCLGSKSQRVGYGLRLVWMRYSLACEHF